MNAKALLRARVREALENMSAEERADASEAIKEHVLSLPEYRAARRVLCFHSLPTEPNTDPLIRRMREDGKRVYLPKVRGRGRMDAILAEGPLEIGALGIREPTAGEIAQPEEMDLVITPGVAFDRRGARLGHGGGYYDRFLARIGGIAVGLAFERQLADRVPEEAHDVRVARVVTERAIYEAGE